MIGQVRQTVSNIDTNDIGIWLLLDASNAFIGVRMSKSIRNSWFPIFASVPTVTFLVLGLFCGPAADDFVYATWWGQLGYFAALRTNYLTWQGRYTSSSILFLAGYLSPTSAVLDWYWLLPTSLILSVGASTYVLLRYTNRFVLESAFTRRQIFVVGSSYERLLS